MTASPHLPAFERRTRLPWRRPGLRALAPALILLGVCVFAWGLRYKLSFYSHPHSVTHRMAEAKLLLTDRNTVPAAALRRVTEPATPLAISLWIPTFLLIAGISFSFGREWALEPRRVHTSAGWFRSAPSFIRPPPSR